MTVYFPSVNPIKFEGKDSKNPLSYRYYNANQKVLGKTMAEHLRIAICYWHSFCWHGNDAFGHDTFDRPWLKGDSALKRAENRAAAAFEFIQKLGVPFYAFHDRDVAPEGQTLKENQDNLNHMSDVLANHMDRTGIQLLWGTANLFSHKRYMAGAATNPNPEIFAYACAQIKQAIDVTHRLKGHNYVLWGGREGYDTLLNTDLKREANQFARFLSMVVDYKHKIGFKGLLLIEPKPCEPTKHQYDFDSATVFAFLQKYGLEKEFKVNIEGNHATLAGHSFAHEVAYACANDIFGSIDANQGDAQLGWDTDQFPLDLSNTTQAMYHILQHGGFTSGGFNFDTKVRRQSIDLEDLFYGHIGGIDALARALLIAAKMLESKALSSAVEKRYAGWNGNLGKSILDKKFDLTALADLVAKEGLDPKTVSGQQELLENTFNHFID
jgi:xylose isomerase